MSIETWPTTSEWPLAESCTEKLFTSPDLSATKTTVLSSENTMEVHLLGMVLDDLTCFVSFNKLIAEQLNALPAVDQGPILGTKYI